MEHFDTVTLFLISVPMPLVLAYCIYDYIKSCKEA